METSKTLPLEEHKMRHKELHSYLDELVADFIIHTGNLPSETSILELMKWSAKQLIHPDCGSNEEKL